jgi:hypothetical protein
MSATDAMVARLAAEIEERGTFQNQLIEAAQSAGRDLNAQEMELYQRAADRITACADQLGPLQDGVRIAQESAQRSRDLAGAFASAKTRPGAHGGERGHTDDCQAHDPELYPRSARA